MTPPSGAVPLYMKLARGHSRLRGRPRAAQSHIGVTDQGGLVAIFSNVPTTSYNMGRSTSRGLVTCRRTSWLTEVHSRFLDLHTHARPTPRNCHNITTACSLVVRTLARFDVPNLLRILTNCTITTKLAGSGRGQDALLGPAILVCICGIHLRIKQPSAQKDWAAVKMLRMPDYVTTSCCALR